MVAIFVLLASTLFVYIGDILAFRRFPAAERRRSLNATLNNFSSDGGGNNGNLLDFSSADGGENNDNLLVFVGYLSAPGNHEKRDWLRKHCFPQIRDACQGFNYATAKKISERDDGSHSKEGQWGTACDIHFFIGQPNDPHAATSRQGHEQGVLATHFEIDLAHSLQNESDLFGDIHMLPMRDSYFDLPSKTLSILRLGVQSRAETVLKIDDDRCPDMAKVLAIASSTPHNVARYVGHYEWNGTEYEIMKGADGSTTPYMSGPGYLLSRALARAVALDNINHSVLYMPYGSSSEDVDMGKWFVHAKQTHPELKSAREAVRGLTREFVPPKNK